MSHLQVRVLIEKLNRIDKETNKNHDNQEIQN